MNNTNTYKIPSDLITKALKYFVIYHIYTGFHSPINFPQIIDLTMFSNRDVSIQYISIKIFLDEIYQ